MSVKDSGIRLVLPAKLVAQMGWVKGDKIEVGYDPETGRFGLRRAKAGFSLGINGNSANSMLISLSEKWGHTLGLLGVNFAVECHAARAEGGILYLDGPTVATTTERHRLALRA